MTTTLQRRSAPGTLLARLIDAPDLVRTVRELPGATFSALVRHVGVEDAGELVALATTEQLVAAFDEDLFRNERPGERETFDAGRFAIWLEVLLEAGEAVAAQRVARLSPEFVVQALASLVIVLDNDALCARMAEGDDDARYADKAIESSFSELFDGYLLVSRKPDGWDAALALIVALDRDHRPFLERVLERCADIASPYVEDIAELTSVLSAEDSLSEDVEAEREERRSKLGYVEPRAARSFLALARQPAKTAGAGARDPITRAYFRELQRHGPAGRDAAAQGAAPPGRLIRALRDALDGELLALPAATPEVASAAPGDEPEGWPLLAALRRLAGQDADAAAARMEELAYLANVLLAGAEGPRGRLRPAEAVDLALATVSYGAALHAGRGAAGRAPRVDALCDVLRERTADELFRQACRALTAQGAPRDGLLRSRAELDAALAARAR